MRAIISSAAPRQWLRLQKRPSGPLSWFARRLLASFMAMLAGFILVFSILRVLPGDPALSMLGERAGAARLAELREALGLNLTWPQQLLRDLARLAHGDLGRSLQNAQPVSELLLDHAGPTLALAAAAMSVAALLGLPLGIVSGWRPGGWADRLGQGWAALALSVPSFWLGPMLLLVFAVRNPWLPLGGYQSYDALILPALTLGLGLAAMQARMLRASLLDVKQALFVQSARAKGASQRRLLLDHALRPSLTPLLTVLGLQLGGLLSGAIITETIFQWPGLGRLLVEAVAARDYPVIQGVVLALTAVYISVNLLVDSLQAWIDPRMRQGQTS